jgi:hypothetical protein
MNCKHCSTQLWYDGLVYVDSTDGDCCWGDPETGENENELHAPDVLGDFLADLPGILAVVLVGGVGIAAALSGPAGYVAVVLTCMVGAMFALWKARPRIY